MKKKLLYMFSISLCFAAVGVVVNAYNPYLRTDIFRSFAKGNWYITSERDTLYTMGYYGVRKYLAADLGHLQLLAENGEFCEDRIMGRGGCVYDQYLYVTARSFLPGAVSNKEDNGKLLILRKSDLSIVKELKYDIKLVEAKTYGELLVVSGLKGFYIYSCSVPNNPEVIFSYRHPEYREYQGFEFIEKDEKLYVAFTLFGEGLEIWDLTEPEQAKSVCLIPINEQMADGNNVPGGQSMDIIVNYPYLYATLGPNIETFKTERDRRGIFVYDISNIDSVRKSAVFIPEMDWYSKNTGDKQPTYITQYDDRLYVNFAEKGVAEFDLSDPGKPRYEGINDISGDGALIQPIFATDNGKLFGGSYYWSKVYSSEIYDN
ncbi:MAG TPA: hypothetical protein VKZ57_14935 [Sphingobacterium sp.]|nr:hypothetical protein [Sphingobacterium sp.]